MQLTRSLAVLLACSLAALCACQELPRQGEHAPAAAETARPERARLQVAGVAENPGAEGVVRLPLRNPHSEASEEIAVVGPLLDLEVARASPTFDMSGYPAIGISLAPASRKALHEFSARHVDRQVAIVLDGVVVSVPIINEPLMGDTQIAGRFTQEEDDDLVRRLSVPRWAISAARAWDRGPSLQGRAWRSTWSAGSTPGAGRWSA